MASQACLADGSGEPPTASRTPSLGPLAGLELLRSRGIRWLALALCVGLLRPAPGQTSGPVQPAQQISVIDASRLDGILTLKAPWRFTESDDPRYADPAFDDSGWPLLQPDQTFASAGLADETHGYAWARIRLRIVNASGPLGVALATRSARQFTVFANGVPLASTPAMQKRLRQYTRPSAIALPQTSDLVLAVRFLTPRSTSFPVAPEFPVREFRIGHLAAVTEAASEERVRTFDRDFLSTLTVSFLFLAFVPIGFTLFLAQRRHAEYLWLGSGSLLLFAYFSLDAALRIGLLPYSTLNLLAVRYAAWIALLCDVGFVASLAGVRRRRPLYLFYAFLATGPLLGLAGPPQIFGAALVLALILLLVCVPFILIKGYRRGQVECGILLPFFAFFILASLLQQASIFFPGLPWPSRIQAGYIGFDLEDVGLALMLLGLLVVVLYRFIRVSEDEQRAAGELEAARTVQQILIPERLPTVPGYTISSVYQPARQVGGDFFQILPLPSDSALILIGDVSGKGMQAAMTVSLLVGALRSYAECTQSPSAMMSGLNRSLFGRNTGFTTCLILHIATSGAVIAANAGHLLPYLDGRELELDGGLPLGFTLDAEYAESHVQLAPGETLTLLTDGVVEATHPTTRALFGFERTQAISGRPAHEIAEAATRFGHPASPADDITVLTITRTHTL